MMHRRKKSGEQSDSAFYLYIDEKGSIFTNEGKDKKKIPEAELPDYIQNHLESSFNSASHNPLSKPPDATAQKLAQERPKEERGMPYVVSQQGDQYSLNVYEINNNKATPCQDRSQASVGSLKEIANLIADDIKTNVIKKVADASHGAGKHSTMPFQEHHSGSATTASDAASADVVTHP